MKTTGLLFVVLATLCAQVPNPTQQPALTPDQTGQPMPVFRVTVVSRTIPAINYHHRSGTTHIDFRGTELMAAARGEARVDSQMGATKIDVHVDRLTPANQFGAEYLTYVLWAITPEGRAQNLGELALSGNHSSLLATSSLQVFGLIVTAEPYFAVTQPSDVVVMENFVRNDTTGTIEQVEAKYELLKRGQYVQKRDAYQPIHQNPKGPLQLAEAENAVEIARLAGADKYAADTFQKATLALKNAEDFMSGPNRNGNGKPVETNAREAAQMAEDARIITYRKMEEEQLANERRMKEEELARQRAAAQQAQASAQVAESQRADADAQRANADAQRAAAEEAQRQAQAMAAQAAQDKAAADAARAAAQQQQQQAEADADRARQAAAQADAQRQQAEAEKTQMRERLKQQLNAILETRETARGLIVNISDVLFDFNKYMLKPGAREKMAKVSGILLAYPGLKLQLEGHTDSVGSDDYNLKLSQQRADAVRDFLAEQGVGAANITAVGMGKSDPVASNDSAAGRQQNRRVDLVVSGEAIGVQIGGDAPPAQPPAQQ
jgi:outer membrane protein OmpA-like peptidoglycan-associated protein